MGVISFGVGAQSLQKQKTVTTAESTKPSSTNHSQKTVLWSNDFSVSADWTTQDIAGSGDNWVVGTTPPGGTFAIGPINSTTASNGFALFDSDLLCSNNQNAIIRNTDPIDLSGETNISLEFESYYRRFQGTTYVGFSTDAVNWTYVQVHTSVGGNQSTPNPDIVAVPASVIEGSSTAYICFRYQGGCDYAWMVDDVRIIKTPDYDLIATYNRHHTEGYQYSQIPLSQVSETVFEVGVLNNGINDLTNIELTVNVTGQTTTSITSAPIATLASGEVDTLSVSFTPAALGVYNFSQELSLNETDENPANNTGFPNVTFEVTDYTYAVDKGAPYTDYPDLANIFLEATIPYTEIGNSFDIFTAQDIYGIDVHLSDSTEIGSEFYGLLYVVNPDATTAAELWTPTGIETDMFIIDANTSLNTIHTLQFGSPYSLNANDTYMIAVRTTSGRVVYSGSGSTTSLGAQSWGIIQNPSGITWAGLALVPVIRMNLDPSLSVGNIAALEGVKVYPNPSEGVINVSNDLNVENTIVVTDITGKVVASEVSSVATTIDLSKVGTGIYLVEVANLNGRKVERIVIK